MKVTGCRRTDLPAFLTNPTSASTAWQISQQKQSGCQLLFIALITRPMMNSPWRRTEDYGELVHKQTVSVWSDEEKGRVAFILCYYSSCTYHTGGSRERTASGSHVHSISCPQTVNRIQTICTQLIKAHNGNNINKQYNPKKHITTISL